MTCGYGGLSAASNGGKPLNYCINQSKLYAAPPHCKDLIGINGRAQLNPKERLNPDLKQEMGKRAPV